MSEGRIRPQNEFKLSSLMFSVYLPTILFSIGEGAVIPVIPLFARDLGSSVAAASLVVAMRGLGQLVFDLPAGVAVSKWGDKGAMVAGTALVSITAVGATLSPSPIVLALLIFVMGGGWAFWQLARLAYVSEEAPLAQRGRALSMMGGMNRIGNFIGPALGGFIGTFFGLQSAFIAQAILGLAASAMMFMVVRESANSEHIDSHGVGKRIVKIVVDNRRIFVTSSFPLIALGVLRQARQVFLPLWGDEIGLGVEQIGLVTSMSFMIDAAVFYPIGTVMDSFGRKWVSVPCLGILGIGLVLLPLTHGFLPFLGVAFITGLGNGFGSGIVMTMGADFAPDVGRGEFLGVWRLVADIGQAGGPAIISLITGIGSLGLAAVTSGGIGLVGAGMLLIFVPETLNRARQIISITSNDGTN
jgi:MFS family permease